MATNPISKYEGYYTISTRGVITALPRTVTDRRGQQRRLPGKVLRPTAFKRSGHLYVTLCRNGTLARCWVHRLVLETFVGPCPDKMECRHIDGDPINNTLKNLEWATRAANIADRRAHGQVLLGSVHPHAKLKEADIPMIRALFAEGISSYTLAKRHGVCQATIMQIVWRETWTHV